MVDWVIGTRVETAMVDNRAVRHPRFARAYVRVSQTAERRGAAAHRDRLLVGLTGRVIEVGAGNGLNFAHYPVAVTEVLAIEPEPYLRTQAERAAARARVAVTVREGTADALPAADGEYDAVVASLMLCSVPDQDRALAEMRRVLRPGGELRFYEHVRSRRPVLGLLEDLIQPLWSLAAGGCHPNRRTVETIERAGFHVIDLEQFGFAPVLIQPPVRHVLGRATVG